MENKSFFIFAGEASGDLHGSHLIKTMNSTSEKNEFWGVGGPLMGDQGLDCLLKMEEFEVMGFSDVILSLPKLIKHFYAVVKAILKKNPDCVILIDYPGFNLRLAKKLRKKGYKGKIVQYICPSVWAHGKERIKTLEETLDLLLVIFPFEVQCFSQSPLQVTYIGNPLVETIKKYPYDNDWYKKVGLKDTENLVSIFPGSREGEVKRLFSYQLQAAELFKKKNPEVKFLISYVNENLLVNLIEIALKTSLEVGKDLFFVPKKFNYEMMRDSRIALAKSGTVTLELALHHCPSVVVYRLSSLNYLIAKYILKLRLPYYCIVNILAGKEVFRELIGKTISPKKMVELLDQLFKNSNYRQNVLKLCKELQAQFGEENAIQNASKAIKDLIAC